MKKILNIAGGKLPPLPDVMDEKSNFVVNVDLMYQSNDTIAQVEQACSRWVKEIWKDETEKIDLTNFYVNSDIFEFLEKCRIHFDVITVYRFLEHVPRDKVLYFIYLLSTAVKAGGFVDVIVPDYFILCGMLRGESVNDPNFEKHDILLTTEMLNEPFAPHASIWTAPRATKFFELESRFKVKDSKTAFLFDGRDIYLRFSAVRLPT